MKGWRKIDDKPRSSVPRCELIIPKPFWLFQTIQVNKLIQPNYIVVSHDCPNHHTIYDDPLWIWHKLPKNNVEVMEQFHYEGVDGKAKTTQEGNLIEAHLTMSEGTRFLTWSRKTNSSLFGKLKPIPISAKGFLVQGALLLEGVKWPWWLWNRGMGRCGYRGGGVRLSTNSVTTGWQTHF